MRKSDINEAPLLKLFWDTGSQATLSNFCQVCMEKFCPYLQVAKKWMQKNSGVLTQCPLFHEYTEP